MKDKVIFLCSESENVRERLGYTKAFIKLKFQILFCENEVILYSVLQQFEHQIFAIVHPEPYNSFHSLSIWDYQIPNIIFQWDTFTILPKRIAASKPYDVQIICHPRFRSNFLEENCKNVLVLPWCIDNSILEENIFDSTELKYDIGWIGRSDAKFYVNRRIVFSLINSKNYYLNNTKKYYTWNEMFKVFQQSKIVVNVSRDDFAEDANMRCFEAMGCGALLLTQAPTELEEVGLQSGKHFITYKDNDDLIQKIDYYLQNDEERKLIALNGKTEVLKNHTYQKRVEVLVDFLRGNFREVIQQNSFRRVEDDEKYFLLAFSLIKDGNLQALISLMKKTSIQKRLKLSKHFVILLLIKLKRHFF